MMKLICKQCGKPINTKNITNGKSYHGMCMLDKMKEIRNWAKSKCR